jgi:hypothetical protein
MASPVRYARRPSPPRVALSEWVEQNISLPEDTRCRFDGRGRRTPRVRLALDERNALLIEAAQFFPGCSDREVARLIRTALLRFQLGSWRRDRSEALCPPRHAGRLDAVLWCLLKIRDAIPSERLIRLVLSRSLDLR